MSDKKECRIRPLSVDSFQPVTLMIDIKNETELDLFIKLFKDWEDDILELLQAVKDKNEMV